MTKRHLRLRGRLDLAMGEPIIGFAETCFVHAHNQHGFSGNSSVSSGKTRSCEPASTSVRMLSVRIRTSFWLNQRKSSLEYAGR
jgi:hypothetical protein